MQIPEVKEWIEDKNKLLVKLDTYEYKDAAEKDEDCKKIGELIMKIQETTYARIKEEQERIPSIKAPSELDGKKPNLKEAKYLLKYKYEKYRLLAIDCRTLVDELVEIKKKGRDLMEKVYSKDFNEKDIIPEILRY